ncbi:hypothetical protein FACS1894190_17330 [Spirochaetia bacterium]|nr:hypothetical protein FACS1894190_17330 [Spirochaetia bacterium]
MADHNHFHSLVSLADCKTILGIDDREDAFAEFLLVSSSYAIEEYCMRRLLHKRVKEWHTNYTDLTISLKEYPVREIFVVETRNNKTATATPEYYKLMPETGSLENIPFLLRISPSVLFCKKMVYTCATQDAALRVTPTHRKYNNETIFIKYIAGYKTSEMPPSLKDACIELVAWKYARHKGKKLGVTPNNKTEVSLENKMPEHVKELLEPYRRKTI